MAIYVIDDHPLMREAIVMVLRRVRPGSEVVELSQLSDLDRVVAKNSPPELFCLDLKLPDTVGISGVKLLKGQYPHVPLAVISATPAADVEEWCTEAGADVYVEKSAGASEIALALRAMLQTDTEFGEAEEGAAPDTKLSKRQKQLIVMLDEGLSNREIAERLGISEHTVKVHLWRLFRRLGVKSRTQTLHFARMHGLLSS
ncbi:response regulator transcription factor [Ottowia sp.]|uniref:response regulator transcription factor n=1 Tax=Ottowia sp. TaxID=1898956 RepID=UPI002CC5D747|nr:response regulator transcription factor [Ottowia sp.]MCP5257077.1 response regulator transcription factor [Burkholderiaceae bacterium]HRW72728.1 response regulator transcription factor [Ottowia sp.]